MKAVQSILTHTSPEERKQIRSFLTHKYPKKTSTRIYLFDILSDNPHLRVQDVLRKCNRKFSRQTLYKTGLKLKNDILSFYLINDLAGRNRNSDSVEAECWKNLYALHLVSSKNAIYLNEAIIEEVESKAKEYELHSILLQVAEYKSKNSSIKYEEYSLNEEVNQLAQITINEIQLNNIGTYYLKNASAKTCESDHQFRQELLFFLQKCSSENKHIKLDNYIKFNQLVLSEKYCDAFQKIKALTEKSSEMPLNFSSILYIDQIKTLLCLGSYQEAKQLIEKKLLNKDADLHVGLLLLELLCFSALQKKEDGGFEESYKKLCSYEKLMRDRYLYFSQIRLYQAFFYIKKKQYQKGIFEIQSLIRERAAPIYFLKILEIICFYLKGDYDLLEYKMDSARKIKCNDTPLVTRMKSIAAYMKKSTLNPQHNKADLIENIRKNHPWKILGPEKTDLTQVLMF